MAIGSWLNKYRGEMMRKILFLLCGLLFCFGVLCRHTPATAQTSSFESRFTDLIKKAKDEGELTWYQGLFEPPGKEFSAHFQQRFGIRVQHQFMPSGPIYERFKSESVSGRYIADVFSAADTWPMIDAMRAGFIAK